MEIAHPSHNLTFEPQLSNKINSEKIIKIIHASRNFAFESQISNKICLLYFLLFATVIYYFCIDL